LFKKSKRPAGRVVRYVKADGTVKEYRYGAHKPKARPRAAADSLSALIRSYERSPEWGALAPATKQNYGIYLRPLDKIGHLKAHQIKRREMLELRDAIARERGSGAGTGFVRAASALFRWAVDRGWIEHSPMHRVRPLPGGHLEAWSLEQVEAATEALPEHLRRAVILALYTGQRRGDLASLTWSSYDGRTIQLRQQKTGAELAIPVHPALKPELDTWKRETSSTHILVDKGGLPWKPIHLSQKLPRALRAIGLPPLGIHGLRKLCAAMLAQAGCTIHEIASITGHKSLSMVQLYTASVDQGRMAKAAIVRLTKPENTKPDKTG
jgi:integrase